MRTTAIAALVLALFGVSASESALARKMTPPGGGGGGGGGGHPGGGHHHHHHYHGSSFVGFGFGGWWYPPAYYYPVPVAYPVEPVTYIERSSSAPAAQPSWWYYCDAANGYYPHVKTCPAGWQRVPPVVPPP